MKPGELFITTSSWDAIHMRKNPYGVWVPKQKDLDKNIIAAAADNAKCINCGI